MDSSAEDFEWDDALPYHPPPKWRPFLGAALVLLAVVSLRMVLWIQGQSDPDVHRWAMLILLGLVFAFSLERPANTSLLAQRLGWGLLAIGMVTALLAWVLDPNWGWIALVVATWGACLFFYSDSAQHRVTLLSILLMLPFTWTTNFWTGFVHGLHRLVARFTGALLDGFEIPNERADTVLKTIQGNIDTSQFADGYVSLEWFLTLATLYALIRRTPAIPWMSMMVTLTFVWMSMRSGFWAVYGNSLDQSTLENFDRNTYFQIGVGLEVVAVLTVEFFYSRLLEPMRSDAVATEFPLFVEIYNLVFSFPKDGIARLNPESEWMEMESLEGEES